MDYGSVERALVHSYNPHGQNNQLWMFEPAGSGYAIATLAADPPAVGRLRYLGLSTNNPSNNGHLIMVEEQDRVIWTVQSAVGNTFRCVGVVTEKPCFRAHDLSQYRANGSPKLVPADERSRKGALHCTLLAHCGCYAPALGIEGIRHELKPASLSSTT